MVDVPLNPTKPNPYIFDIYIYIYKEDLALNNPQWLICHKPNTTPPKATAVNKDKKCSKDAHANEALTSGKNHFEVCYFFLRLFSYW